MRDQIYCGRVARTVVSDGVCMYRGLTAVADVARAAGAEVVMCAGSEKIYAKKVAKKL